MAQATDQGSPFFCYQSAVLLIRARLALVEHCNGLFLPFSCGPRRSRIHFVGQRWEEKTHQTHILRPADLRPGEDFRTNEVLGRTRESTLGLFSGDDGESGQGEWTFDTSRDRFLRTCARAVMRTRLSPYSLPHQTNKLGGGGGEVSLGRSGERGESWG